MNNVSEAVAKWTSGLVNVAQTIAIVIAGIWTYQKFIKMETPSLQPRPAIITELHWSPSGQLDSCRANFVVTVRNDGKTLFTVENVLVRIWDFKLPQESRW